MHTYRVTIDTLSECYEYEVQAENELYAEIIAVEIAKNDGWDGTGLPRITVDPLD